MTPFTVFLVDDHALLRNGIERIINKFEDYHVCGQAGNGKELIEKFESGVNPNIVLLDIQMPEMNGEDTAHWIKKNFPYIKVLALSMYDDDQHVIGMIRAGAVGYILKDASAQELKLALDQVRKGGFYHSELVSSAMLKSVIREPDGAYKPFQLQPRHIEFLKLVCTELTYKEVADKMNLSVRTIDGYRDELFEKLKIKSRVGLVIFAIKNDLVKI